MLPLLDEPGVHANAEPTQQLFELVQRALGRGIRAIGALNGDQHRMAWGFVAKRRRQVDLLLAHDERRRSEARSLVADASRYMYSRYRSRRAAPRISRRSTIQN